MIRRILLAPTPADTLAALLAITLGPTTAITLTSCWI